LGPISDIYLRSFLGTDIGGPMPVCILDKRCYREIVIYSVKKGEDTQIMKIFYCNYFQ